jgi:type II secretory pathway pseudopilin PulG
MSEANEAPKSCGSTRSNRAFVIICLSLAAVIIALLAIFIAPKFGVNVIPDKRVKAYEDIKAADAALSQILADTGLKDLRQLFVNAKDLVSPTFEQTIQNQSAICLQLLNKGKDTYLNLRPQARNALKSSYLNIDKDPWGQSYMFYLGPTKLPVNKIPFRSYKGPAYIYNWAAYTAEKAKNPNTPEPETSSLPGGGFPAPQNKPIYIFSFGVNRVPEQLQWRGNGGDDINNWDDQKGWLSYRPNPLVSGGATTQNDNE